MKSKKVVRLLPVLAILPALFSGAAALSDPAQVNNMNSFEQSTYSLGIGSFLLKTTLDAAPEAAAYLRLADEGATLPENVQEAVASLEASVSQKSKDAALSPEARAALGKYASYLEKASPQDQARAIVKFANAYYAQAAQSPSRAKN